MSITKQHRIVLDTDTFNEVDDQFALAYAALSPAHIKLEAVYAAPFHNARSSSPGEGMEKSYDEIFNILNLLPARTAKPEVFRGSTRWIESDRKPVESPAAIDLVARAMNSREDDPLIVVGIAAPTNISSALLMEPRIADRVRIIWLGGHPLYWPNACEFNLHQNLIASQILLEKSRHLFLVPCINVAQHLLITEPDLRENLPGDGGLGDFLRQRFDLYTKQKNLCSKPLWDIAPIASLINPDWLPREHISRPILTDEKTWQPTTGKDTIEVATEIRRDPIFADVFAKLKTQ